MVKLRTPIAVHDCLTISSRKEYLLLLPVNVSTNFIYSATSLWLTLLTCLESSLIKDFTVGLGCLKSKLKDLILCRQKMGDQDDWCEELNFNLK